MSTFNILKLQTIVDGRGRLTVLEDALPFVVQRIFWITESDNQIRGGHSHKKTRQALVALSGSVTVLMDDGKNTSSVELNTPNNCLIVEPEDWHTMKFKDGAVLLVFASEKYDSNDYVTERQKR